MKLKYFSFMMLWMSINALSFSQTLNSNNRLMFYTDLNGQEETPAVTTNARGIATVLISEDLTTMTVNAVFSGLSGPITGCHFHNEAQGVAGPVVVNLSGDINGNRLRAEMPVPAGFLEQLLKGRIYLNAHTAANPGGEIRGQMALSSETQYNIMLDGQQEVPSVTTDAAGVGFLYFSPGDFFLRYYITFNGLSGLPTGVQIRSGAPGVSGPVVLLLNPGNPGSFTGTLNLSSLPASFLQKLEAGELYANISTENNPDGEIRGQLKRAGPIAFQARMNGSQEVPEVVTSALGAAVGSLNATLDSFEYAVCATGLTPTAAHFHSGEPGESGPVIVPLSSTSMPGFYQDKVPVNGAILDQLLKNQVYVNVHTADHPDGEIRGQVLSILDRVYAFDLCGQQEVPAVAVTAVGAAYVNTNFELNHLNYRYIVDGLSGNASSANFQEGAYGMSGSIYLPVNKPSPIGSGQFQVTANDVARLESGALYLNVTTAAHPDGEVRGQIDRMLYCTGNLASSEPQIASPMLAPNPAVHVALLTFDALQAFDARVRVMDPFGKVQFSVNQHFESGKNSLELPTEPLQAGWYMVQIQSPGKGIFEALKLIKQ